MSPCPRLTISLSSPSTPQSVRRIRGSMPPEPSKKSLCVSFGPRRLCRIGDFHEKTYRKGRRKQETYLPPNGCKCYALRMPAGEARYRGIFAWLKNDPLGCIRHCPAPGNNICYPGNARGKVVWGFEGTFKGEAHSQRKDRAHVFLFYPFSHRSIIASATCSGFISSVSISW